jgi:predicted membrane channel-forming protein YqfA (hemolysin III family)
MVYLIKIWLSDSFSSPITIIVYLDAATDPYSAATTGAAGAGVRRLRHLNECDWRVIMILVICSGLPVEVEMLDASAACVFHLLIFRWVKVLTLRLQMGFHKAIL